MSQGDKPHYDINEAPALFEKFIKDFDKTYKDAEDRENHYQAFVQSLKDINRLNAEQPDTTYDINQFADYTDADEQHMFGLRLPEDE
ncbi:unnamed protein product [Danaus chrysippus]|uniref:(African queen) hypothetical protein n=1 Tax=Danaus chrysippus TaxID=151541 RepID=A0A8J2RIX9_9NEOP|nr:unnamed protein product [Danaus chrysippus]